MTTDDGRLARVIEQRVASQGAAISGDAARRCAAYLSLLARWNRTINLTALPLDPPSDAAIDRLIVEPAVAAAAIRPSDRVAVDLGSGGGSPALPLAILCPWLQFTLVESRARKCAFLREASRALDLAVDVVQARFQDYAARPDVRGSASVVTARAVRADAEFLLVVDDLLSSEGRLLWFGPLTNSLATLVAIERIGQTTALARKGS